MDAILSLNIISAKYLKSSHNSSRWALRRVQGLPQWGGQGTPHSLLVSDSRCPEEATPFSPQNSTCLPSALSSNRKERSRDSVLSAVEC